MRFAEGRDAMRRFVRIMQVTVLFIWVLMPWAWAQGSMEDSELWDHLQRRSAVHFERYVKSRGGCVDSGVWRGPIESAFRRLIIASGNPPFNLNYCVVSDNTFNAAAFPGGQFFINRGILMILEQECLKEMALDGSAGKKRGIGWYRERHIAPILAHELAHYYNRHMFFSIKKEWSYAGTGARDISIDMIKYTQKNELDADYTGYLYLQRAGYEPRYMIQMLNLLNLMRQDCLARRKCGANSYLDSHPSPHERLSKLKHQGQSLHEWAFRMEQTFTDIQTGRHLRECVKSLENSLKKLPENLHLQKAYAVALHKLWLSTVSPQAQKLRAVIDMPSFRDSMVLKDELTRRGVKKVIPGNQEYYFKAMEAYERVYQRAMDSSFLSNYGVLLCYSNNPAEEKMGLELTYKAVSITPALSHMSNYALALYLTGDTARAKAILQGMAVRLDVMFTSALGKAEKDPKIKARLDQMKEYVKKMQQLNPEYVHGEYTPILNLALLMHYEGESQKARGLAAEYFKSYDSSSSWARYLSEMTETPLPKSAEKKYMAVAGVRVGDSLKFVLKTWGKPSIKITDSAGNEIWYYKSLDIKLCLDSGMVVRMDLNSPISPKAEGVLGVGMPKERIEKVLGPHKYIADTFFIYEGPQRTAVLYVLGVAQAIILLP